MRLLYEALNMVSRAHSKCSIMVNSQWEFCGWQQGGVRFVALYGEGRVQLYDIISGNKQWGQLYPGGQGAKFWRPHRVN